MRFGRLGSYSITECDVCPPKMLYHRVSDQDSKMRDALISIVVPVYNAANYIHRCIQSIISQTYTNLEIIIVNDGSTDASGKLIDELAGTDARIRVIHIENGGVTKARLTGMKEARGEWIGFVDADDEIEADMYERLLLNANKYQAVISHCGYQMVFPSRVDYYYNTGRLILQDQATGLKDLLEGSFIEPGLWNKLFHKTLFHSLLHSRLEDMNLRNMEDLLMNFYLFRAAEKAVYEDFCPYHYLVREGSAATSMLNKHKLRDPLLVFRIIKAETTDNLELQQVVNSRLAGILINHATMSTDGQPDLIRPFRDSARRELRALLPELRRGDYSRRIKVLSSWAALWPFSYRAAHALYSHLRGTDRKYELS